VSRPGRHQHLPRHHSGAQSTASLVSTPRSAVVMASETSFTDASRTSPAVLFSQGMHHQ
jgi:hypothetical protein